MFKENYIINGEIECKTGLHIGGSSDSIDIGGSDNVVIRDSISGLPFIPGSSLKGKLRSLLELYDKQSADSVIKNKGKVATDPDCLSSKLFGISASESGEKYPTRTIVRDSYPTEETLKLWESSEEIFKGTELKYENTLNRITSEANPRNIERVPKGSKFNFEIILTVYEHDDESYLDNLLETMKLVEDNYLGGSGSRGFGQIKFTNITIAKRTKDYYTVDNSEELMVESSKTLNEAIDKLNGN